MRGALQVYASTAVWDYSESDGSFSVRDRAEVFSRRDETNPFRRLMALRTKVAGTGEILAEIVAIPTTSGRMRPSVPPYAYEETVATEEWLALSDGTLDFWDNEMDAAYDDL